MPACVDLARLVAAQAAHDFPLLTVAGGISADDGAENRILFVPTQLVYLSPGPVAGGRRAPGRDPELRWARSPAVAHPVVALGDEPYLSLPLPLVLAAAGAEPTLRRVCRHRASAYGLAAFGLVTNLPVPPPSALGPVLAMDAEQGEQVAWPELASTVAGVWSRVHEDRATRP